MAKFVPIQEVVDLPLLGNSDELRRGKGRLLKWSPYVYDDLNLDVLKITNREYFRINKRTNSIDIPCGIENVSSVSLIDKRGVSYPVWLNQRLLGSIPDISAAKDCACEYKCGHVLCNTIKGYEAVVSTKTDKTPEGEDISFTCVDRKGVLGEIYYEETQYPMRIYVSGVWTETVLHTEQKELCKVQVDKNGCVCDTEQNINLLCSTCDGSDTIPFGGTSLLPPHTNDTVWSYYCNSKMDWFSIQCGGFERCHNSFNNIYNINDTGNRLIFPHNFGFEKVLVRFYSNQNLKDMKIPMISVPTFVLGLKWWDTRFNDKMQNLAVKYEADYTKSKWGLLGELNRDRIEALRMTVTPPVFMPSFNIPRFFSGFHEW
jgi:hypothetical protein